MADFHARASSSPRCTSFRFRVRGRFHWHQRMTRSLRRSHPSHTPGGFRPLPSEGAAGVSSRQSASPVVIENQGSFPALHVRPFAEWSVPRLWPLLTSAAPSRRLAATVALPGRATDLPRARRTTFVPYPRPHPPGGPSGFGSLGCGRLVCGSCSSGRNFACSCLRFRVAPDTLAVRLTVPVTRVNHQIGGHPHKSTRSATGACAPCAMPGTQKKGAARRPLPAFRHPSGPDQKAKTRLALAPQPSLLS